MASVRVANLCESEHACHPHQIRNALERFEIQLPGESGSKPIGKPVALKFAAAVVPSCLHVEALRTGQRLHAQSDYPVMQLQVGPQVRRESPKDRNLPERAAVMILERT
jgi:hypothetical protein